MRIEVFYIDGCPNHEPTVERVKAMLKDLGVAGELVESAVNDPATVSALRFLGSPTVQINGLDIEPSARYRTPFGMMCRTYEGSGGVPCEDLIRSAIAEALSTSRW